LDDGSVNLGLGVGSITSLASLGLGVGLITSLASLG